MVAPTGTFDDEIPWGESYYALYLDTNLTVKALRSDPSGLLAQETKVAA